MKKIIGKEKSISDLLARKKYSIHYYQREYRWGKKQIEELIDDLTEEFLDNYDESHIRKDGANYGHYYLGSVVITSDDADRAIIDGQQRLTSLTLLLIYLDNLQRERIEGERVNIGDLIYSEEYGAKSFNISVEEREPCLNALYKEESFNPTDQPESVQTIYARYKDIEDIFPDGIKERALPFFLEWLTKKVMLVEITAYTEQDAHKIFVSMNDRGLSLTPTEMLKGYLLSEIKDDQQRNKANELWKTQILALKNLDPESKEEDADFVKNWLRAQYADTIRETKKGAEKEDFDLIGTEFHKWVRENGRKMGLNRSEDYEQFVLKEFKLFVEIYLRLKKSSKQLNEQFPYVFFNASNYFTLQYQIILSAIDPIDSPAIVDQKIHLVSCFIDQYIARRVFHFRSLDYSTIKNAMFTITKNLRRLDIEDLKRQLRLELDSTGLTLDNLSGFYLNLYTKRYILHFLGRITHYIENGCGLNTRFEDYINRYSRNPYDIEHIWSDHWEEHQDEFSDEVEFRNFRNRFGALLLLPRDKNRSFQDNTYEQKLPMYFSENMLARTLNSLCYHNNPQFLRFKEREGLDFKAYDIFKKEDILERQRLYQQIAQKIWDVGMLI